MTPGVDAVDIPVRSIIGDAIRFDSVGIVLAHNHPSGQVTPSRSDKVATRALAIAAEAIDLRPRPLGVRR
jgi:DNA repair protein RadC